MSTTTTPNATNKAAPASSRPIPELENGDRLTRAEFERRYEAIPGVRAELIEGVVYIKASPVRAWRVLDRTIDWFVLRDGRYEPLAPESDGLRKSPTFPGLWLDSEALTAGDLPKVIAALNRGLATPEHAAFVEKLERARADQSGRPEQG